MKRARKSSSKKSSRKHSAGKGKGQNNAQGKGKAKGKGKGRTSQAGAEKEQAIAPKQPLTRVHRCRFIQWQPQGISAMAFNYNGSRLAVGRENGDIEIWNALAGWFCEKLIPGTGDPIIQTLVWTPPVPSSSGKAGDFLREERLFSAGLNSRLIEWDLQKLVAKYASDSYGGAVWSCDLSPHHDLIALGTYACRERRGGWVGAWIWVRVCLPACMCVIFLSRAVFHLLYFNLSCSIRSIVVLYAIALHA